MRPPAAASCTRCTTSWACNDLLVLSTCNRTEVYYAAEDDRSREIILALGHLEGPRRHRPVPALLRPAARRRRGRAAPV